MTHRLPESYHARPAEAGDIPKLAALDAAYTTNLFGRALVTEGEIRTEWKAPHFDPQRDARVIVAPDDLIVAWAEVYDFAPHVLLSSKLRVLPQNVPPEVPEYLITWCIERAKAAIDQAPPPARVVFRQAAFEDDRRANQRLLAAGLEPVRVFLRMQIEMHEPPVTPVWPEEIQVRAMVPGVDDVAAVRAIREIFRDHWGYVETPFEEDLAEWKQWIHEDDDFDTDLWFLAMDGDQIAGFCQCYPVAGDDPRIGLIDELGVRRSHRGQGLATALLLHAFGSFYKRGKPIVELGVDAESLTGATRLYEKVGMKLVRRNNLYELELRPGNDITTSNL